MDDLFRVFTEDGEQFGEGLTLESAAHELLTYDGFEYELRHEGGDLLALYVSTHSSNSTLGAKVKNEWPDYKADTEKAVYMLVWELGGVKGSYMQSEPEYKEYLELLAEDE